MRSPMRTRQGEMGADRRGGVLNAAPSGTASIDHQEVIVSLGVLELEGGMPWTVVADLGVRVSETSRPEPDLAIQYNWLGRRDLNEVFVVFEVLVAINGEAGSGVEAQGLPEPGVTHSLRRDFPGRRRCHRVCP